MSSTQPKKFHLLGYEVGGWGALLAFIISIVTLSLTAVDRWFLNAKPVLKSPETINLVCQRYREDDQGEPFCPNDSPLYVIGVPIILINDTAAPHAFTAVSSDVVLQVYDNAGGKRKEITLSWQYIGDPRKPIGAITVQPQSNVSREIQYHPRRAFREDGSLDNGNFWLFSDFQKMMAQKDISHITLSFKIDLLAGEPFPQLKATCKVPIDPDFRKNASLEWPVLYSRECFEM